MSNENSEANDLNRPQPEAQSKAHGKLQYQRPVLTVFGLVKDLTQAIGSQNGDAGQGMMISDRALKENVVRVGEHPLGIGLYLFNYKAASHATVGRGRQFGVMADEVQSVMAEAVINHADGYLMVNYSMLGIELDSKRSKSNAG